MLAGVSQRHHAPSGNLLQTPGTSEHIHTAQKPSGSCLTSSQGLQEMAWLLHAALKYSSCQHKLYPNTPLLPSRSGRWGHRQALKMISTHSASAKLFHLKSSPVQTFPHGCEDLKAGWQTFTDSSQKHMLKKSARTDDLHAHTAQSCGRAVSLGGTGVLTSPSWAGGTQYVPVLQLFKSNLPVTSMFRCRLLSQSDCTWKQKSICFKYFVKQG